MAREGIPTWSFSIVIVRKGDRFLLVHERKHGQLWYFPAGRVEPGETFEQAAIRETREEAGIDVVLDGVIRMEQNPAPDGNRMRMIFVAKPANDAPPKSVPDDESLGAGWFTLEECRQMPLRGPDVMESFDYVAGGGRVLPMECLALEGSPLK